jgi:hypothetical protein
MMNLCGKNLTQYHALRDAVKIEVNEMLRIGIIEPSDSPYNAPIVLVKKPNNTIRFCCDFRGLNLKTKFDCEPTASADDIYAKLGKDKYLSKFDFTKGYWQTSIPEEYRDLISFSTPEQGCFRFCRTPFGLKNSGATFNRLMRLLPEGANDIDNFVDDIIGHTIPWDSHVVMLRDFFTRVRVNNLTLRATKCMIGFPSVDFIGNYVGGGKIEMDPGKVTKIQNAEPPMTKKQLKSFLGMAGWFSSSYHATQSYPHHCQI